MYLINDDEEDLKSLYAAFTEYASERWDQAEWNKFGRETGTSARLDAHPRLYRSLTFGDNDYSEAVWQLAPYVVPEAADGESREDQFALVAEYMPDLPSWMRNSDASARLKKRFAQLLDKYASTLPSEWIDDRLTGRPVFERGAARSRFATEQGSLGASMGTSPAATADTAGGLDFWGAAQPSTGVSTGKAPAGAVPPAGSDVERASNSVSSMNQSIFLVHGRQLAAVRDVQVFVQQITGILPESLADSPGRGDTIIEKFERRANDATFAIVLLTPDDRGGVASEESEELHPRARQNVVLELGYFIAKLGRDRVAVLNAGVERPSDIDGVSYIAYPDGNWKWSLSAELEAAGFKRPTA